MFGDNELNATKKYIKQKKNEILNSNSGSDLDYIRDLQTLIILENAVDEKLEKNDPLYQ